MSSKVEVLCPNGHRVYVKTTQSTTLLKILEEACTKQGFNPHEFDLCHANSRKILDLTLTVRFAGLPNNAKLELVKAAQPRGESQVTLALQLPEGERLKGTFPPNESLWNILEQLEKESSRNLTKPESEQPVCVYMREEVIGEYALRETSLKMLGLVSGTAIIRLIYKVVEAEALKEIKDRINKEKSRQAKLNTSAKKPVEETVQAQSSSDNCQMDTTDIQSRTSSHGTIELMETESAPAIFIAGTTTQDILPPFAQIPSIFPPDPPMPVVRPRQHDTLVIQQASQLPLQPDFTEFKFPEATKGMALYSNEMTSEREVIKYQPCDRDLICYNTEDIKTSSAVPVEPDDDFFELTVTDVQRMYNEQQQRHKEEEDTNLLTMAIRKARAEERLAKYDHVFIRFTFPDKYVLQATFRPKEPVYNLYKCVTENLQNNDTHLYLFTSPPKTILKDKTKTLMQAQLVPMTVVYVGTEEKDVVHLAASVKSAVMPQLEASKKIIETMNRSSKRPAESTEVTASGSQHGQQGSKEVKEPKVPKWFKIGKK